MQTCLEEIKAVKVGEDGAVQVLDHPPSDHPCSPPSQTPSLTIHHAGFDGRERCPRMPAPPGPGLHGQRARGLGRGGGGSRALEAGRMKIRVSIRQEEELIWG